MVTANFDRNSPQYQHMQQQQADQYGITVDQLAALQSQYQPVYQSNNQGGQQTYSSGGQMMENPQLTSTLNTLGALKKAGISLGNAGQTGQQQAQGDPSALNLAQRMGAAALGQPEIDNPTPSQFTNTQGGVSQVPSPRVSTSVPTMPYGPWSTNPGALGATSAATTPNAQGQLPGTPTATPIPNPVGSTPATPYATAPAAPGANATAPVATAPPPPDPMTHYQGLYNAGRAIVSYYGMDPNTASEHELNNFHSTLQTHIASTFGGSPSGVQNYTAGVPPGGKVPAPIRAAGGGMVPGRGDQDTVPALLTPGEYVIPKQEAAQIFGGREPVRMAGGGTVPDDDSDQPPEARRRYLETTATGQPSQNVNTQLQPQQPSPSNPAPAAPGMEGGGPFGTSPWQWAMANRQAQQTMGQNAAISANTPAYPTATTPAAADYAAAANAGQITGGAPSAATVSEAASMTPAQTQGSIAQANMGPAMVAGGISNLAQGLASAAQTYANSVKPWEVQPDATEKFANNVVRQQPTQFQEQQVGGQQQKNPYTALMPYMMT